LGQLICLIFKGQKVPEEKDYHSTLRNTPEERGSQQHRGESLKSLAA
jgi:hypothetical protein